MADIDRLLAEFRAAFEADPRTRPQPFLARAEGIERRELAELIDGYLAGLPRSGRSVAAPSPAAAAALARAEALFDAPEGSWRDLLPALREGARLRRDELAARLADALGVGDRAAKVGRYYALMEDGRLEPRGVSERVLEALAGIVGTTAARLREAGARPSGAAQAPAFAAPAAAPMRARAASDAVQRRDEVDRLFTGG
jgi:hypothetical protein